MWTSHTQHTGSRFRHLDACSGHVSDCETVTTILWFMRNMYVWYSDGQNIFLRYSWSLWLYIWSHIYLVPNSPNSWNFLNSNSSGSFVTILGLLSSVPEILQSHSLEMVDLVEITSLSHHTGEYVSEVTFEEHLRMQDGCQGNQPGIELVLPVGSFQHWNLQS